MADTVVRISFERDGRKRPCHPHIESIVQEQIRQRGADNPTLRSSCHTRNDATVLQLYWSLRPAFDVESAVWTVVSASVSNNLKICSLWAVSNAKQPKLPYEICRILS